jgi:hypothetical protein
MRLIIILIFFIASFLEADKLVDNIVKKVYNMNHSLFADNIIMKKNKKEAIVILRKTLNTKLQTYTLDRYLNNKIRKSSILSKDLIIIKSGKLKSTGILITEYAKKTKSAKFMLWLPALRKTRRIMQPGDNGGLGEIDIAFIQESKMRRVNDEVHILMDTRIETLSLGYIDIKNKKRYLKKIPTEKKIIKKNVYVLKSTPKKKSNFYDYRISYIDTKTFIDYKNEYYKNGLKFKIVDRRWHFLEKLNNKKAYVWHYWYSKNLLNGYENALYIPFSIIKYNKKVRRKFWSEETLKKIHR